MSGEYPYPKFVSPAKCIERPWDLWVSELGHSSPRPDEIAFVAPAPAAAPRRSDTHSYKAAERRHRRAGLHRLRLETMNLHGICPQIDNLNAAVCHMCGVIVKCSAAYRHLVESHPGAEPLLPPPPPVATLRSRTRHKKEQPPPSPVERLPLCAGSSPVHTAAAPLSRLARPHELQYLEEAGPSSVPGEVQVCVESGELPVVSIQDTEELPLGENITDDIFDIMNSEGIQSADDITNATDWKNIIRDIGNLQDINFSQTTDTVQTQDLFASTMFAPSLPAFGLSEADVAALQQPPPPPPPRPTPPVPSPALTPTAVVTPTTPKSQRRTSKTKFKIRDYDANKNCGVLTADNKPCTRSLTCKAHALSLRRMVEGRAKPFDTLLAEHRAAREAGTTLLPPPPPTPTLPPPPLPLLVNNIDLNVFNGLTTEQTVDDIYSLLGDDHAALLADPSAINSLLSQPLDDSFVMPEEIPQPVKPSPLERIERVEKVERVERHDRSAAAGDVFWYSACPRPLALCTYNAAHAGGAVTLGKKFATVRSNIKSSLSRSQCKNTGTTNNFYYGQGMSLSKSVNMNQSKTKPEVRRLIVCSGSSGVGRAADQLAMSDVFGSERRLNGHVGVGVGVGACKGRLAGATSAVSSLDLDFALDPMLADGKC